ncbi:MAG: DEAD/DEAH box helicase family protein [Candidatus Thermoplasmatota archaeon]|nr:DEAD/DEAH box helicase family protein [Candidatus Thermoplasmatota archaeon]
MSNFCDSCGSLLVWDFSDGKRSRKCPRCGRVSLDVSKGCDKGRTSSKEEKTKRKAGVDDGKYSVKKGVSPRTSRYAANLLYRSLPRTGDGPQMGVSAGDRASGTSRPDKGDPAPEMFPFETVRAGQKEFMEDVGKNVSEGHFLLASVPTGIGKTAASLSPALEYALANKKMVLFMTSKQSQHRIVVDTLRRLKKRVKRDFRVVDVVSKQSMCPRDLSKLPHVTFSILCKQQSKDGTCPLSKPPPGSLTRAILEDIHDINEIIEMSGKQRICPHRAALDAAKEADVLICDFNYLFSDLSDTILSGLSRDLDDLILIVDEAHNLPDRIRSNQSEELSVRIIEDARETVSGHRHLKLFLGQIRDIIIAEAKKRLGDEGEAELDKRAFMSELLAIFQTSIDGSMDMEMFIEMLEDHAKKKSTADEEDPVIKVAEFLKGLLHLKHSHILYLTIPDGKSVESLRIAYRNLDPGEISGPIFKGCHSAVLMSGTLSPPSMFGDILGMKRSRSTEREYPSPFPKKNRLVLLEDRITTAYRRRSADMYRTMAERIVSLTGSIPGNVAVFFPSYSMLRDVKEYLWGCPKKTLLEDRSMTRSEKERIFRDLVNSKELGGALLLGVMGGSLSEGVDYRDNLLSGVFVVGLPLAPPSLEVKALREYYRGKFGFVLGEEYSYIYPAMNRILQAAGRSIRSEKDRSVVVLMESRLKEARYLKFLPVDLRPTLLEGNTMERAVEEFYQYPH